MDFARGYLYLAAFFIGSFVFLKYLLPFFLPFALAAFLAVAIEPLVARLERRWHLTRSLGSGLVITLFVVFLGLLVTVALTRLWAELVDLAASLPDLYRQMSDLVASFTATIADISSTLPPEVKVVLDQQLGNFYQLAQTALGLVLALLQGWLSGLPGLGMIALITAIATYFISKDKKVIGDFILRLVPTQWRPGMVSIKDTLMESSLGLIKAQAVLVFLTFLVTLLGLNLLGNRYALTIAVFSALLDVLPVLGPALIFVPWFSYAFLIGETNLGVGLLALYGIVALVRGIAQPYVIGERLGLHPLTTLIALFVGVKLFGASGFIYGPLVAIVARAAIGAGLLPLGPGGAAGRR